MIGPELGLVNFECFFVQGHRIVQPPDLLVRRGQITHGKQRQGVVDPELELANLEELREQRDGVRKSAKSRDRNWRDYSCW